MRTWFIYQHIAPNGKMYIGQTCKDPIKYWENGKRYLRRNSNEHFKNAIQKYGWDNFQHIVLYKNITLDEANFIEEFYISIYKSNEREFGYNKTNGGGGNIPNEEVRKKMSENHANFKGANHPHYGTKVSQETKDKISKNRKGKHAGEDNNNFGKHLSDETKIKISIKKKGVKSSIETRDKMSKNRQRGKHPNAKAIICFETGEIFECARDITEKYGFSYKNISAVCLGKRKTAFGYIWKFYDKKELE